MCSTLCNPFGMWMLQQTHGSVKLDKFSLSTFCWEAGNIIYFYWCWYLGRQFALASSHLFSINQNYKKNLFWLLNWKNVSFYCLNKKKNTNHKNTKLIFTNQGSNFPLFIQHISRTIFPHSDMICNFLLHLTLQK